MNVRSTAGVGASIPVMAMGALFALLGFASTGGSGPYEGGSIVKGTVVGVVRRTSTHGPCDADVAYELNERSYRVRTSTASSALCSETIGSDVDVSYLPTRPNEGRALFAPPKTQYLIPIVGVLTFVSGLLMLIGGISALRLRRAVMGPAMTGGMTGGMVGAAVGQAPPPPLFAGRLPPPPALPPPPPGA